MRKTVQRRLEQAESAARGYLNGVRPGEVPHQLGRDASRAWEVLTREQARGPRPDKVPGRVWYHARLLFLGVSAKLSPARRVLFVACLAATMLGLQSNLQLGGKAVLTLPSPLLLLAVVGLVLLLVLELADRVEVRDELELARVLQRDLLPASAPELPGYAFAFSSRTANTIGGDYYDFLPLADGRLAVVVGDASGHGIAAGLLMAIANTALKLALDLDPSPGAVAAIVNRALCRTGDRRAFMTLFVALLEPSSGRLEYVCAGHPYPLLRRAGGEVAELGRGGLPLGIRLDLEPPRGETVLAPGDLLVLYTDGVPEAVRPSGDSFGFERLTQLVGAGGRSQALHDRILAELERFRAGADVLDDRSLVVVERRG